MTKEGFASLQELHRSIGLNLLKFLQQEHISYSTYNYWKHESTYALDQESEDPGVALVPITIKVPDAVPSCSVSGMTFLSAFIRPIRSNGFFVVWLIGAFVDPCRMDWRSFSEEIICMTYGYCNKFYIPVSRCQSFYEEMTKITEWERGGN